MRKQWLRRCAVGVIAVVVSSLVLAGPQPAHAAGPGWVNSEPVLLDTNCGIDQTTLTPIPQISTLSTVGYLRPDTDRNVRTNEPFLLQISSINRTDSCETGVKLALRLPAGVRLDTSFTRPVGCFRYQSSNVNNLEDLSSRAECPQAPQTSNGFLVLSPFSRTDTNWGIKLPERREHDTIEIQLRVVADTSGSKTLNGRICDIHAFRTCEGTPAANALPSLNFVVDAATGGSDGPPPSFEPAAGTEVEYNEPNFQTGGTALIIATKAFITSPHEGRSRAEVRPKSFDFPPVQTIESDVFVPGTRYTVDAKFTSEQLLPWTGYYARTCFVETSGPMTCGNYRDVSTLRPDNNIPATERPLSGGMHTTRDGQNAKRVLFSTRLSGARPAGNLLIEVVKGSGDPRTSRLVETVIVRGSDEKPARGGTIEHRAELEVYGSPVTHRACFVQRMTDPPFGATIMPVKLCSDWRTDQV